LRHIGVVVAMSVSVRCCVLMFVGVGDIAITDWNPGIERLG